MRVQPIIPHPEYLKVSSEQNPDRPDYNFDSNSWSRRLFLYHGYQMMKRIHKRAESSHPLESLEVEKRNLASLMPEDDCVFRAQNILNRLQMIRKSENKEDILAQDIIKVCYREYQADFRLIFILVVLSSLAMLAMTVVFQFMLEQVIFMPEGKATIKAYLLITLTIFFSSLMNMLDHNLSFENLNILLRIKQPFILLFYLKTIGLTSYNIKNQSMEKTVNGISSDFNIFQQTIAFILVSFRTPIKFLGITIYLIAKLNWIGMASAFIMLLTIPVHYLIGKKTGAILSEVSNIKDQRIKFYAQIIEGIKFVKIYGWEIAFTHLIQTIRNQQISGYIKYYFWNSISQGFSQVLVLLSGYAAYLILYSSGQSELLSTVVLLSTIQAISNLRIPMHEVSISIPSYYTLISILERFAQILNAKCVQMQKITGKAQIVSKTSSPSNAVELKNFSAYWKNHKNEVKEPTLKNISITLQKNGFYGVTGKVGSGKSTFFQIFLEQLPFYSGSYSVNGKIAYVEQDPILFSDTVKMNILMGRKFNQQKYNQVLKKSCIEFDLEDLEHGDQTEIGEKGIKLSGGQRVRLSLARAIYSNADIFLFDDPISALDSKVSKSVFQKAILSLKRQKTILLITHQLHFLLNCDKVILFDQGSIKAFDHPSKLNLCNFETLNSDFDEKKQNEVCGETKQILKNPPQEKREETNLSIFVYCKYFLYSKLNWFLLPVTIILSIFSEVLTVIYFTVLSTFDQVIKGQSELIPNMSTFWIFLGIVQVCYFFLTPVTFLLINLLIFNSNSKIHENMIQKLIRSHLMNFDLIANDELLSRFSNDLTVLDTNLPFSFKILFERLSVIIVAFAAVSAMNISFIAVLILGVIVCIGIVKQYKNTVIFMKRLHLLAKRPIFKSFTEIVFGNLQLRLAGQCGKKVSQFAKMLNQELECVLEGYLISRSLGMTLAHVSIIVIYLGLMLGAFFTTNPPLFGVQMILLMKLNSTIEYVLREVINNQTYIVSVDRALEVTQLQSQAELKTQYDEERAIKINYQEDEVNPFLAPRLWPQNASLSLKKLQMRYRKDLSLALKGISFGVKEGQRVGIVGRTGAGKSSIFQALLRMTEPEEPSEYLIGGFDALQMGLHSLRRNISVIPQNSFILNDTIRRNLDPFNRKLESQLWESLEKVALKNKVLQAQQLLDTKISCDEFFSAGEKQLFCLARVLLYPNRILILDEATSNVDLKTDALVQECVKENFRNCSVVAIAHRLDTIADYDKILVMEKGRLVESGTPRELVDSKGHFWEMIENTGVNAQKIYQKINRSNETI